MGRIHRPTLIQQHRAFALIDQIHDRLARGEVEIVQDRPVFQDPTDGKWYFIDDALDGWVQAWQRIVAWYRLPCDFDPILRLRNRLALDEPLTADDVANSQRVVDSLRRAYRGMDVYQTRQLVQTTELAIKFQDAGLAERPAA